MDLEPDEIAFIDEYFHNGFRAGKAYQKVHPDVTYNSACVLGSKLLRKVKKSPYFTSNKDDVIMDKDEYLKILSDMARQKKSVALNLLGRLYIPTKVEGNLTANISWTEFISSNTKPNSEQS